MTEAQVRRLFGTDGIRGTANQHPMTPEIALRLGGAIGHVARRQNGGHQVRVVVGKDTRLSCYMLETAIASGLCAMGARVMLSGPIPTPGVAQLTTSMRADAGVVISASHNPYDDNGIKVFGRDGYKLDDALETELEALIDGDDLDAVRATGADIGNAFRLEDAAGRYVVFCKNTFPSHLTLDGVRIVVDAAHGAAYKVAPLVFRELGAHVISLGVEPDGRNINDTGALHPEMMAEAVRREGAHLGIALDGDADRVIVADDKGEIVDGDAIMALCATRMLAQQRLPKRTVVTTVMSNLGLERAISKAGGKMIRTAVGDRYVVERMRAEGLGFGGEQSGHLIFLDHATTGDGIVAALQLLAIVVHEERPLRDLAREVMDRVPQVLVSERFSERRTVEEMSTLTSLRQKLESELGTKGRVVIRWSGTEPKLRIMVEGDDLQQIEQYAHDLVEAAKQDLA